MLGLDDFKDEVKEMHGILVSILNQTQQTNQLLREIKRSIANETALLHLFVRGQAPERDRSEEHE